MKEKKEIGKLLELLNEYDPYIASDGEHKPNLWGYAYQGHSAVFPKELAESYIISARYGFVKWLVENDKIDFELDSIIHKHKGIDFNTGKGIAVEKLCNKYESLLMLLSISENPIEDLISYLR